MTEGRWDRVGGWHGWAKSAGMGAILMMGSAAMGDAGTAPEVTWEAGAHGRIGTARLEWAPFPDDSRTTGFQARDGREFPAEQHYRDNTVTFFVPPAAEGAEDAAFIVHFHGHNNTGRNALTEFTLDRQLATSGRRAVLIMAQGPLRAPDSGGGKLEKPGAFTEFVKECAASLGRPVPETVILSAHSGGYRVTAFILAGGPEPMPREVWLWDASYANLDLLAAPFAEGREGMRLRSVFTDHLAARNAELMAILTYHGRPVALYADDHLVSGTLGVSRKAVGAPTLESALRDEPLLFLYTRLNHNSLQYEGEYFRRWAEAGKD